MQGYPIATPRRRGWASRASRCFVSSINCSKNVKGAKISAFLIFLSIFFDFTATIPSIVIDPAMLHNKRFYGRSPLSMDKK